MVRRFLLPLLGVALFATTAATAQTAPATPVAGAYSHAVPRTGRTLTAREKRTAEATAKAEAAKAAVAAAQVPTTTAPTTTAPTTATASSTSWNGWSEENLRQADTGAPHRPTTNLSVAPGMPINQVGHGVTTDYHGRPLRHEVASTTISTGR